MKKTILFGILFIAAVACKKTRACECKNNSGIYNAGEYEGTARQAKSYCKSLSEGETNCYMK